MKIGYVRVSSISQNEQRQIAALKDKGIEKIFTEKISAKSTNRPELKNMLSFAREGDVIYVHSLDRLARNTKDLLTLVEALQRRNISLVSNKESIDTSTATGKLMLTMIGAIHEFERANLLERQKEGIAIAKEQGKYKGRKKIEYPENWHEAITLWMQREITATRAMEMLGLKKTTFYKLLRQYQDGQIIEKRKTIKPKNKMIIDVKKLMETTEMPFQETTT